MRRRLFERLQKSIPRALGEHVRFVQDVDLVGRSERQRIHTLGQRANIFDAVIARGVHLVEVVLGTADGAREDARDAGLPKSARAGEEVRVADLLRLRRLFQGLGHLLLSHDVRKLVGAIRTIERLVRHSTSI